MRYFVRYEPETDHKYPWAIRDNEHPGHRLARAINRGARQMDATTKLAKIEEALRAGRTVYIRTALKCTAVKAKHLAQFAKINRALFKTDGKSLYMSSGNKYVCIDYCTVTAA